jgi:hypothetical protein
MPLGLSAGITTNRIDVVSVPQGEKFGRRALRNAEKKGKRD